MGMCSKDQNEEQKLSVKKLKVIIYLLENLIINEWKISLYCTIGHTWFDRSKSTFNKGEVSTCLYIVVWVTVKKIHQQIKKKI